MTVYSRVRKHSSGDSDNKTYFYILIPSPAAISIFPSAVNLTTKCSIHAAFSLHRNSL